MPGFACGHQRTGALRTAGSGLAVAEVSSVVVSHRVPGSYVSVESSARMWLADVPVALASERVTAQFCQQVGGRLASARDLRSAAL